jgi:hypothetical protein
MDTSKVQYFLLAKATDIDFTHCNSRGKCLHVAAHDPQYGSILWQAYPVKRINIDIPCKPDDASDAKQ